MPPNPLNNFEIQIYYQNEQSFNGVYSRDNLPKIRNGETHWAPLYVNNNAVNYFDSFGVEHIPEENKTFISNKNIKTDIFKIQAYNSIKCRYFCIRFINLMLVGKTFSDFTNLFSPNNFKKTIFIINI